jgi:hypothetical protein
VELSFWCSVLGCSLTALTAAAAETNATQTAASPAAAAQTNATEKAESGSGSDTNAPAAATPLTPEQLFEGGEKPYNNWVEVGAGGFVGWGNQRQFQQNQRTSGGTFGGLQDLHFQQDLAKGTTMSVDGRALFEENDYQLRLNVAREKLGYIRLSYDQFRTWYNGDGGYYQPTGAAYLMSGDALELDRGEVSFEAGLRLDNVPKITFKYTHAYREGDKSSTIWAPTHPTGDPAVVRGLSPSVYGIDEQRDIFQLDVTHKIKATEFGGGLRYETAKLDNDLKTRQWPGEPIEQKVTDRQNNNYDTFSVNAFSETWVKKNMLVSAGVSFTDLDNDFSGSRIYGTDFDVGYVPSAQNGLGYYGLNGGSRLKEYTLNLNLLTKPTPHLSIVPSLRVMKEDMDANSSGTETLRDFSTVPFTANSDRGLLDVRERLDINYNGITNWVLYGRLEFAESDGNLQENGGLGPVNGIGVPPIQRETDDSRFLQKYSAGARWYPVRMLTLDAGGYYKNNHYDYDHEADSTPNDSANRYPAYLTMQEFDTYDGNLRLTLKPLRNLSLVTRYEYQWSTIQTRPDAISGLTEVESSQMRSHILAQDVNWSPWSRLYLQVGFNYVISETDTPASRYTQALLNAQNNYWTLNFSAGLVLDEKSDLRVGYLYYQSDNFQDNSEFGLPLGMSAQEHGVTATYTRRLTKNVRLNVRYGYFQYVDETFGGTQDYQSHMIYSSLQYRF